MFTGIIERTGEVRSLRRQGADARLEIGCDLADLVMGESVAVDGVCLTVAQVVKTGFAADVSGETLRRSVIGTYRTGTAVNLERALRLGDRLGGHLVAGHIDRTALLHKIVKRSGAWEITVYCPGKDLRYVVDKGSVAVNGISLTVAKKIADGFALAIVPHTLAATTIGRWRTGGQVNVEFDQIAKYVETTGAGKR
ncbi:MAG: riboflavin synthase [Candidatus Edwardsbacteria bacterium]|jgi:riboflavin synthase|nr:riboflavin synthase [Candidatus Edwardsbacteria bacterium]